MPKVYDRRIDKARELFDRLASGPAFSYIPGCDPPYTPEEAKRTYRRWFDFWLKEEIIYLVPELQKMYGKEKKKVLK